MLVDSDGVEKPAIRIILEEVASAGIDEVGIVITPGDHEAYAAALHDSPAKTIFLTQEQPLGYGHALLCAADFAGDEPILHLVSDHLFLSGRRERCAEQLIQVASAEACSVSAVQRTRESLLKYYGTYGVKPVPGRGHLYVIEKFFEKPPITVAEQELLVPGLRAGFYLCSFGMHVFTSSVLRTLARLRAAAPAEPLALTPALSELAAQEKYLACELDGQRYNFGQKYGFLTSQLALSLAGRDREDVLAQLLELVATHRRHAGHGSTRDDEDSIPGAAAAH